MPLKLILVAIVLSATSGILGAFFKKTSAWGQRVSAVLMGLAALSGLAGSGIGLLSGGESQFFFIWPAIGNFTLHLDPLNAFFLVPVFLIGGLGPLFGMGYWKQKDHPQNAQKLQLFWGLLVAGMGVLLISRHALVFLAGWEVMALSAFFLISTEDDREECRKSSLVYLISTHIGTLTLFGFFVLWRWTTGSFDLAPVTGTVDPFVLNVLFFLALFAFGLKAGMMPLHFWLPGAHASAPSHVSAMLSGVLLKMGIYGLIRVTLLLPTPPVLWGGLVLFLGVVSGLLGVVFAIAQHDIKKLLAYHSVENIGIILMGLGLALLGRSAGKPEWIVLGMSGCLLHVWNHSLFKPLLFFGAGSAVHSAKTRQIDEMGGLAHAMPWTALFFLIGAVAICGIPPLNGFISELMIYLGLFNTLLTEGANGPGTLLAVPALAMIGALAAACFIKVFGSAFLGSPRTSHAKKARESSVAMVLPMAVLAALCTAIGIFPGLTAPLLGTVTGSAILPALFPFKNITQIAVVLIAGALLLTALVWIRKRSVKKALTWDCGYAEPTSRMQYTASSFGNGLVTMFKWVLRPKVRRLMPSQVFPPRASLESRVNEAVLDRVLAPAFHKTKSIFTWFHRFQNGRLQGYVLYILIALLVLLATLIPFGDWMKPLFTR